MTTTLLSAFVPLRLRPHQEHDQAKAKPVDASGSLDPDVIPL